MKTKLIIGTSLLLAGMSFAQPQTKPNEIAETRDYMTAVINRMSGTVPGKYLVSADYAVAGPEFEKKKNEALAKFKLAMDFLAQGGLVSSIDQYNTLVNDTSLSIEEIKIRKETQLKSLQLQAKAAEATYQAALRALYFIEPIIRESVKWGGRWDTMPKIEFSDGSTYKGQPQYGLLNENTKFSNDTVLFQIKKILWNKCKDSGYKTPSQTCIASLLADLSAYYNDVHSQINRDLSIKLADGNIITLKLLSNVEINLTLSLIPTFVFDADYNELPFKN